MSTTNNTGPHSLADGMRALRAKWGWLVGFGVFSVIAGVIALGSGVMLATATAVLIIGCMMLMAGAAEIAAAFNAKDWSHRVMWLALGALYVLAGFICILNPFQAATWLTLMLGIALIVGGLLRVFLATRMKQGTPWGWVVASGIITFLLGLMIVAKWPISSAYVLGIFLGIDLIFIGAGWITMGLALKRHARS
ncbi:HdeD family acid-resistance protein [soil metagenome]